MPIDHNIIVPLRTIKSAYHDAESKPDSLVARPKNKATKSVSTLRGHPFFLSVKPRVSRMHSITILVVRYSLYTRLICNTNQARMAPYMLTAFEVDCGRAIYVLHFSDLIKLDLQRCPNHSSQAFPSRLCMR